MHADSWRQGWQKSSIRGSTLQKGVHMEDTKQPFVAYLAELHTNENRGALAALRRGLGQSPGAAYEMYPYIVPWLPNDAPRWREDVYFIIAALFALHPAPGGTGNMGAHFAQACEGDENDTAVERRFTVLLAAHREDVADHLRQSVSFLRAKDVPVNWHRLFTDMQNWSHPAGFVQREWARSFWGYRKPEESEQ